MSEISVLVRLKSADPAAVTALSALRQMYLKEAPEQLCRFSRWSFSGSGLERKTVERVISHFTDIVNPNKESWSFAGEGRVLDPEQLWTAAGVTDMENSISENWTSILRSRGYGTVKVEFSVLWCLGFPPDLDPKEALRRTREMAVSRSRKRGLLANPVSQRIEVASPPPV